jgi:hypothetical protein
MIVGGRTVATVCRALAARLRRPVRGTFLNGLSGDADDPTMAPMEAETADFRDRALVLAHELGLDATAWYLRVLEESRASGEEPELGALVRTYWELQRVTGRADLRDDWRLLADALWSDAQDRSPQSGLLSREQP